MSTRVTSMVRIWATALSVALALSCASSVRVKTSPLADLSQFSTWDWLDPEASLLEGEAPPESKDGADQAERRPPLERRLAQQIEQELERRGFVRDPERPELLVAWSLRVQRRELTVTSNGAQQELSSLHSQGSFSIQTGRSETETHEVGRVALIIYDALAEAEAWRGLYEGRFPERFAPHLDEAVMELMKGIPESNPTELPDEPRALATR